MKNSNFESSVAKPEHPCTTLIEPMIYDPHINENSDVGYYKGSVSDLYSVAKGNLDELATANNIVPAPPEKYEEPSAHHDIQQEAPSMQGAPASTAVIALINRISQDSQILQNSNPISAPSMGSPSLYRQDAYYHPARQKASFVAPVLPTAHKPNAYALAQKFANNVNFFTHDHCLYVFNGRYFELMPQKTAESLILDVCRGEIAASGTPQISSNVYKFLTTDPVFQQGDDVFTQRFVAFKNGTLDIRTRCFSPNDPQFLTIYGLTCNYYSAPPPCPAFDSFLYQCSGGDLLWIERAWQFIGYALVPDTGGKSALLLQGIGDSGKSKFCEFLQTFFAPQHVSALSISELNQQFAASELEGKLLCVSPDLPKGPLKPAAVSNIKRLSGNDLVSAPKKYEANRQFRFLGTFVIATNHSIYTAGEDDALMKRLITLPFRYTVPKEQQDPFLLEKLLPERDAVASKAIEAYFRLVANHYRFAGEYLPNECVPFDGMSSNRIPPGAVEEFLLRDFTPCEDGLVFVNDIHTEFKQWYPNAPINSFSREFGQLAAAHFGSARIRTHKPGEPYASAAITGINYTKRRI